MRPAAEVEKRTIDPDPTIPLNLKDEKINRDAI